MISQHVIRYRRYDISGVRDIAAMIIITYAGDIVAAISPTPERSGDITRASEISRPRYHAHLYTLSYIYCEFHIYLQYIYLHISHIFAYISYIYFKNKTRDIFAALAVLPRPQGRPALLGPVPRRAHSRFRRQIGRCPAAHATPGSGDAPSAAAKGAGSEHVEMRGKRCQMLRVGATCQRRWRR